MTNDLAAKAAALSPDARRVLVTLAWGPQQWRSVAKPGVWEGDSW